MNVTSALNDLQQWFLAHWLQLLVSVVILIAYRVLDRLSVPRLEAGATRSRLSDDGAQGAIYVARAVTGIVGVILLTVIWGIDIGSIFVFASTAITLLGVALFASWSLLSNVTAHFVLLLQPSFRRGNFVRVFDADNYAEGYITDLGLFSTRLLTEDRETILYPNNLLLSRAIQINPRDRRRAVGKVMELTGPVTAEDGRDGPAPGRDTTTS